MSGLPAGVIIYLIWALGVRMRGLENGGSFVLVLVLSVYYPPIQRFSIGRHIYKYMGEMRDCDLFSFFVSLYISRYVVC